jgi:adenylate kinase
LKQVVVVTGIPGSGKTTLCNLAKEIAEKQKGKSIVIINFGTVMVELLEKRGEAVHRDFLRKSDLGFQRKLQREAAETISRIIANSEGIVIVDTHMSVKTSKGFLPGLPQHVLEALNPTLFVLVEAPAEQILSRRIKDASRLRDKVVEEDIRQELFFSRLMAGSCAVLTGAPVKIVINEQGKQKEAALKLLEAMEL